MKTERMPSKFPVPPQPVRAESRFVVQEHQARLHHFDFRLEKDGVLKSWALPRGVPEALGERRLAIEVPDHPLSWAVFEGTIPAGQYGAGEVRIRDRGTYRVKHWTADKIAFSLHGEFIAGDFVLVRYPATGPSHWLLIKTRAEAA